MNGAVCARSYRVRGRVQGVGFRWFVRDVAVGLGLTGWVRNEPDGSVSVGAEGTAEALSRFERRLRDAPPPARVDEITVTNGCVVGFPSFDIRF